MSIRDDKSPSVHDLRRKLALIKLLCRVKERAEEARLYLTVNDRDPEEIGNLNLAIEHIEIAMEHLGVKYDDPI
jgi:uncharacterized protein YsxB (DUF464 family)